MPWGAAPSCGQKSEHMDLPVVNRDQAGKGWLGTHGGRFRTNARKNQSDTTEQGETSSPSEVVQAQSINRGNEGLKQHDYFSMKRSLGKLVCPRGSPATFSGRLAWRCEQHCHSFI